MVLHLWDKWFAESKISFAAIALDWEATHEVFERRHLIVHTGDERLRVTWLVAHTIQPLRVAILDVPAEYLGEALDRVVVLGHLWQPEVS